MTRADELYRLLIKSAGTSDGNPDRSHITNLEHSLRVATLARRYKPDDVELIFMALVHDLARPLSDPFHGEVMAEIVRDMISEEKYHVLRTHGLYQAWHIHGEPRGIDFSASWHRLALTLAKWEVASFSKHTFWPDTPSRNAEILKVMNLDEAIEVIETVCKGRD